jgi:hypothetical protein
MARLYTNENFPLKAAVFLRALGHDVLTSQEAGNANQAVSDAEVLRFGTAMGRAILTINKRDFVRLHQTQPSHAGIIVCSQDPDLTRQANAIHEAIQGLDSLAGVLIRVTRP